MLTNTEIEEAIASGNIKIAPFNKNQLGINFYRLKPKKIRISKFSGEGVLTEDTVLLEEKYVLEPYEYAVIAVEERIVLAERFFGTFYPASVCIEKGLIVTCGHLNPNYTEEIRFGLFNAKNDECKIDLELDIARIEFTQISKDVPISTSNTSNNYDKIISRLRGEKIGLEKQTQEMLNEIKAIDKQIKDLSII
jgi:deoxycytidine triphosphate deaminase